jgi:hypothetical protein
MRYWVGVASKEHVMRGVQGGFAQVCHGKAGPLKQMKMDDWIIYYSPTLRFGEKEPCRAFTAIGRIKGKEPYQYRMSDDFIPYRRDVDFLAAVEAPIVPLIEKLTFISDKSKWGFPFRRGCFFISQQDFHIIAFQMNIKFEIAELQA